MRWETPSFQEIRMDAEISGYQDDSLERPTPPRVPSVPVVNAAGGTDQTATA
jgi:hypothetical protein